MEVRPTHSRAVAGEMPSTASPVYDDAQPDDQLSRIAGAAAHVLGVPLARIYLDGPHGRTGFGGRSDGFDEYVASIDLTRAATHPFVIEPGAEKIGGDGAAVRSFAAVRLRSRCGVEGYFCIGDYRERTFGPDDLALIERFVSLVEGDLEQQSSLRRLHGSEQPLRAASENALDAAGYVDRNGAFRSLEEELRASRDRIEEMNRLKSVFLTNMSHEVRTPLTTILGFAEILDREVTEEQREFVKIIRQGGERLLDTLTSILDLARLESRSFDVVPEEFDVARKAVETCLPLEPLAHEKGLYLRVETPDEPAWAELDVSAFERVVSHLVRNGIKFTNQGGVTLTVGVEQDDIVLHVADTGIGIGKEFMPFLFEDFTQESEGYSRIHEGNGLGLPITKRLVELMNGDMMAESEKGTGSIFTVVLPRSGDTAPAGEDTGRPRVLVAEDNADTRTLVNHLLRKSYEVVCASDGEEALRLAGESRFAALLVDINLGRGKSGEDVLHAIKALPGYDAVPIVAVTAYAMPGDRERFFSEGFDDYVSKPFSKQRLLEALEGVLQV